MIRSVEVLSIYHDSRPLDDVTCFEVLRWDNKPFLVSPYVYENIGVSGIVIAWHKFRRAKKSGETVNPFGFDDGLRRLLVYETQDDYLLVSSWERKSKSFLSYVEPYLSSNPPD